MEFVVLGRTYDTDTSDKIAVSRGRISTPRKLPLIGAFWPKDRGRYESWLYRTDEGEFWLHEKRVEWLGKGKPPVATDLAVPMSESQAREWVKQNDPLVFDWWEL